MKLVRLTRIAIIAAVIGAVIYSHYKPLDLTTKIKAPAAPEVSAIVYTSSFVALPKTYGHAVVIGGIKSLEQFKQLMAAHPELYACSAKDADAATLFVVTKPFEAFTSYRKNGQIHVLSKPVWIGVGETLIRCGDVTIRARCGNVLFIALPPNTTAPDEPIDTEIEVPGEVPELLTDVPNIGTPVLQSGTPPETDTPPESGTPLIPNGTGGFCCTGGGSGGNGGRGTSPVQTPEPSSFDMLAAGIGLLWIGSWIYGILKR